MKKIVIKSKLKEDEALNAFATLNSKLQEKGLLSKGDELLLGIDDQDDGTILIEINGDLMDKDKYKSLKSSFTSLGTIVSNDLKNFDEEPEKEAPTDTNPETPVESTGQEKRDKEEILDKKVDTTLSLHDTNELLINQKSQKMFETLLFSEEELNKSPQTPETPETPEKPEETPEKKDPETKEHDDKEPDAPKDPETPEKKDPETPEKPEEKTFDDLYFSEEELKDPEKKDPETPEKPEEKTFDDLYFSEEELKGHDAPASAGVQPENVTLTKKDFDELCKKVSDLDEKVSKGFDSLVVKTPEKKECPIEKHLALKTLSEYLAKAAAGKDLNVAERYFCDSMKQHFSDEEIKQFSEDHKEEIAKSLEDPKKPEDKEPEAPKDPEAPETHVPRTKDELIRALNEEKTAGTLKSLAESNRKTIK